MRFNPECELLLYGFQPDFLKSTIRYMLEHYQLPGGGAIGADLSCVQHQNRGRPPNRAQSGEKLTIDLMRILNDLDLRTESPDHGVSDARIVRARKADGVTSGNA